MIQSVCRVVLDRLQAFAWAWTQDIPDIAGFEVHQDFLVRRQTTIKTYHRVRIYRNRKTTTRIYVQYRPACPWLAPFKLSVVADDRSGLQRPELEGVFNEFRAMRILTLEVAFDFSRDAGVDEEFVLRHGIFGKSHLRVERLCRNLRFGTRHSDCMVRAYFKKQIFSFRVEIEFHSRWFRKHDISSLDDLSKLSKLIPIAHIQFVKIDWASLRTHLQRSGVSGTVAITRAKACGPSIQGILSHLRMKAGCTNVHRFLRALPVNETVSRALQTWSERWRRNIKQHGGCHE